MIYSGVLIQERKLNSRCFRMSFQDMLYHRVNMSYTVMVCFLSQ